MKPSGFARAKFLFLSCLCTTMFLPLGVEAQEDGDEPRAQSGAWILDQSTHQGYRVADLTDAGHVNTSNSRIAQSGESARHSGQWTRSDPPGYSPAQVRHAYEFDELRNSGKGQIIAIAGAFHYPNAAADMKKFIKTFGLKMMYGLPGTSPCVVTTGPHPCFRVDYATGVEPAFDEAWALESALDTQWAHAIAPGADIWLVEAANNSLIDLFNATGVASALAPIVSMSWGSPEFSGESILDIFFDHTGVTFLAASGDSGNPGVYPAASPFVIGVGGTSLRLDRKGRRTEIAWINSGGGISPFEPEPGYQLTYPIPDTGFKRGIPDVSYNSDPLLGFSVYDSNGFLGQSGWFTLGGTSAATPQWAGLIALANELRRGQNLSSNDLVSSPLYAAASHEYRENYFDIKAGNNGACGAVCTAIKGYDFVTGLGSPRADELVKDLARH